MRENLRTLREQLHIISLAQTILADSMPGNNYLSMIGKSSDKAFTALDAVESEVEANE